MTQNNNRNSIQQSKQDYTGKYSEYQLSGNSFNGKKYGLVEYTHLNNTQNFLYQRALYGLSIYPPEEVKNMHWEKKKRIIKVHKRAQTVINVWKQQIVNAISTRIFETYFPKTEFTAFMVKTAADTDPEHINKISFKTLGIKRKSVIDKLILEKVLPINFYELKPEEKCR